MGLERGDLRANMGQPITVGKTRVIKNNTVAQKITRPKKPLLELILLFWVSEKDFGGLRYTNKAFFSEAAQTRLQNIKGAHWYDETIHKVHSVPIQAVHEIGTIVQNWIQQYGGKDKVKTREIGVFSHCGVDGPITYCNVVEPPHTLDWPHQMAIEGGWDAIDFNWVEQGAFCVFYGSQSGTNGAQGFEARLSVLANFQHVTVWGQSSFSYPSSYPDYRVTTLCRSCSLPCGRGIGPIYMVGSHSNESGKATHVDEQVMNLTTDELKGYPVVNPLNAFLSGIITQTTHQDVFNDHRKSV